LADGWRHAWRGQGAQASPIMTDVARLLQEIAAAQDRAELTLLEHAATRLIDELAARLTDAIRERRDYLACR
jgi:hypothetical protein